MKLNKTLWALALPVALASCTADDLLTEQSENPVVPGRKTVGNITFVTPENANTRLAWGDNGLAWTETDKLGAALMDERNDTNDENDAKKNYDIVDKVYSNYLYTYENGAFTNNNAVFVEGNYFIYAQFREQKRTGLAYEIPAVQQSGTDGRQSWYDNQMWLDHVFVTGTEKDVEVDPLPVFPVITFGVKYEGEKDVVVRKIVVTDSSDKFENVGTMQPKKTSVTYDALENVTATKVAEDFNANNYKKGSQEITLADVFDLYYTAIDDLEKGKYTITTKDGGEISEDEVKGYIANPNLADYFKADSQKADNLTMEFTGEPSGTAGGAMVVPQQAKARTGRNLKFEIYTNKGLVTLGGSAGDMNEQFSFDNDVKEYPTDETDGDIKKKAKNAIKFDGVKSTFLKEKLSAGEQGRIRIFFKDDAILVPGEVTVTSTEELKEYLTNWYTGKKDQIVGSDKNTVKVHAQPKEGGEVDVDNEVLDFMAASNNPALTFDGDITIPAGTRDGAIDKIQKIASGGGDLNVTNNAVQTWTAAGEFTKITNNGTLTVGTGEAEESAQYKATTVDNHGTMTVNKALESTHTINNLGTLTLNADANKVNNGDADPEGSEHGGNHDATVILNKGKVATLTNHGQAVVPAGKTVEVTKLANQTKLTVEGDLTTASTNGSTNMKKNSVGQEHDAVIDIAEGGSWTVKDTGAQFANNSVINNHGTITVESTFRNSSNESNGVGILNNWGQIACKSEGKFNNASTLNVHGEGSVTLISSNEAAGEIVVDEDVTMISVSGADKGKITFIVASQEGMTKIPDIANNLRITSNSISFPSNFKASMYSAEFRPESHMTISVQNDNGAELKDVTFTAGDTNKTFTLNGKLVAGGKVNIGAKANVVINNELEVKTKTGSDFTNKGTMLIIGTLNFSGIQESSKEDVTLGNYLFAGGSEKTNITYTGSGD